MEAKPSWQPLEGTAHAIIVEVLIHGPLPRSEIARRLSLSPATLTRLTKPLLSTGLLVETAPQAVPGMGRPSLPLDVDSDSQHFIGVKLTADEIYGVLTDLRAHIIADDFTVITNRSPLAVADQVAGMVKHLSEQTAMVAGVGVSAGGVTKDAATFEFARYLDWKEPVPFAQLLHDRTGLPVVISNDAEAWTQAELWFGDGKDDKNFVLLTTGAGIGYCLVSHGQAIDGIDGGIGQAAHVPLDPLGPLCHEGHRGCTNAMLTSGSICSAISVGLGRPVDYEEALGLARAGNPVAEQIILASARAYGRLLAMIANFTFVPLIIASGEGVGLAIDWEDIVREEFRKGRDPMSTDVRLLFKREPFTEWARGAAVVAIQATIMGR